MQNLDNRENYNNFQSHPYEIVQWIFEDRYFILYLDIKEIYECDLAKTLRQK